MKKCPRCGFKLEDVDLKHNKCPVCEKVIDPRRKDEDADPRVKMKEDKRVKRPL